MQTRISVHSALEFFVVDALYKSTFTLLTYLLVTAVLTVTVAPVGLTCNGDGCVCVCSVSGSVGGQLVLRQSAHLVGGH